MEALPVVEVVSAAEVMLVVEAVMLVPRGQLAVD